MGPLGLSSPPSRPKIKDFGHRYYDPLRLPRVLLGFLRSHYRPPIPETPYRFIRVSLLGNLHRTQYDILQSQVPRSAGVPSFQQFRVRTLSDLPSSRATPLRTCHVHRPRWYREHSPFLRIRDCCFPARSKPSAFTSCDAYPHDHNSTIFRGSMEGLSSRSTLAKAHTVASIAPGLAG